ncbi:sulfatase family protein [Micromonospora sp. LZ34]
MSSDRPAILLITADQLRRDGLGCYGGRAVATPNLDRMAASGTVYDRAYTASPWCLPSRASMLTGLWPRHHGAYSNFRDIRLSPEMPNLYRTLRDAGYRTAHIGKCHYAPVPYGETRPDRTLPYDDFHAYYRSLGIEHLRLQDDKQVSVWFEDDYTKELDAAGYLEGYRAAVWNREYAKVFTFPGPAEWHPDAWVGRNAVDTIREHPDGMPLFGWISFSGPHFPFDAPSGYLDRVDTSALGQPFVDPGEFTSPDRLHYHSFHGPHAGWMEGGSWHERTSDYWHRLRHLYAANIALIDDQVGAIIDAAEARFGDNLTIVFTCDHGEMLGNHGFWGKNNGYYQDVLHVPLIYRRPYRELAGTRSDRLTSLVDLYPTLTATGSTATEPGRLDGRHLDRPGHSHVYAEGERFLTITDGTHKLVHAHRQDRDYLELFDLATNPDETHNLAGTAEYAEIQRDLATRALNHLVATTLP